MTKLTKNRKIALEKIEEGKYFNKTHFNVKAMGGATAMGMGNPNSKTRAYKTFRNFLRFINR